jgi:choline dehydrogenase
MSRAFASELPPGYSVVAGDPNEPSVAALLTASEAYAHSLYPTESVHMLDVRELTRAEVTFLVARALDGSAHGCGAIVLNDDGSGELKRMFVAPTARRRGLAAHLLARLEHQARTAGLAVIRLETGVSQPEAIALYRRAGYVECGHFWPYAPDPLSVFMEKSLRTTS